MSDVVDSAQQAQELIQQAHITALRKKAGQRELNPNGWCHWCREPFSDRRVFCDPDCEHDYQKKERMK